MVGDVFISMMLNKDAHLSILFWLSLPFQDACVTSLWITEIKELPNAKEKFHKYETLGMCSTSAISFFACAMCVWIVSMVWCVVTNVCRRLSIFLLQSCVRVRFGRAVEFYSNTLSLYLSAHMDLLHALTNVNLLSICVSMFILPLRSG